MYRKKNIRCNLANVHGDFESICSDFLRTRNDANGLELYNRFVESNELDPRISYRANQRQRMLRHPMHLRLKENYPGIDWDRGVTGIPWEKKPRIVEIDFYDLDSLWYRLPKSKKRKIYEMDLSALKLVESIDGVKVKNMRVVIE